MTSSDNGLVTATAGGTLGPSQQTEVTISVSRNGLIEGDYEATVSVLGAGKAIPIAVHWRVDRAPVVHVTLDPPGLADAATCPATAKDLTGTVSASVIDESSVASVVMTWSGPGHGDSSPMAAGEPGTWSAPARPARRPRLVDGRRHGHRRPGQHRLRGHDVRRHRLPDVVDDLTGT